MASCVTNAMTLPQQQHFEKNCYYNIDAFMRDFKSSFPLIGERIRDAMQVISLHGICDPLSDQPIPADAIELTDKNYREGLSFGGLNSRDRAVLLILRLMIDAGQLPPPRLIKAYLPEAVTPMACTVKNWLGQGVVLSEYMPDPADPRREHYLHEDLSALSFSSESFDLLVCCEVFEHLYDLRLGLTECLRVLRQGGVLVATFPFAYGGKDSIIKARYRGPGLDPEIIGEPEYHGNPIEPEAGSLVYQIPGWEILDVLSELGFSDVSIQGIHSISYGVLAAEIPEVLLLVARR